MSKEHTSFQSVRRPEGITTPTGAEASARPCKASLVSFRPVHGYPADQHVKKISASKYENARFGDRRNLTEFRVCTVSIKKKKKKK